WGTSSDAYPSPRGRARRRARRGRGEGLPDAGGGIEARFPGRVGRAAHRVSHRSRAGGGGEALRRPAPFGSRRRLRGDAGRPPGGRRLLRHARRADAARDADGGRRSVRSDRPPGGPLLLRAGGVHAPARLVRPVSRPVAFRRAFRQARHPRGLGRHADRPRHDGGRAPGPRSPQGHRPTDGGSEMKRWEAWVNHIGWSLTALSGIVYGYLKYFAASADPDSRLARPWQPEVLALHVLAAPIAVFGFGLLFRRHALTRMTAGER